MNAPRPPILEILPESAPFTPEQRTWLNGFFAGLLQLDAPAKPLTPEETAGLIPGLFGAPDAAGARRGRRRRALARSGDADRRPHEARGRTASAPPHDGGDGAAGLRPVRLELRGIFALHLPEKGRAAEPVRARRQRHLAHAQEAL